MTDSVCISETQRMEIIAYIESLENEAGALKEYVATLKGKVRALELTVESEHIMRMQSQERIEALERGAGKEVPDA